VNAADEIIETMARDLEREAMGLGQELEGRGHHGRAAKVFSVAALERAAIYLRARVWAHERQETSE
jgi:hypothetical protein